jgi:phosphoribosylglycinamide formyltransferase-1
MSRGPLLPLAVLISGSGSNLQALLDAAACGDIAVEPRVVVSDQPDAYGLVRASRAGVETRVLAAKGYADRAAYDAALVDLLTPYSPGLIALAGFMRILSGGMVHAFTGRMLNIHPALLPAYKGLHTHRRVIADGGTVHGASVHFVTEELDGGPVVVQGRVPVLAGDDEARLSARVQRVEHKIYPLAVGWFASGRLSLRDGSAYLDGSVLESPVVFEQSALTGEVSA